MRTSSLALAAVAVLGAAALPEPAHAAGAASGTIHVMSPAPSLVLSAMQDKACNDRPETQGTDGYVFSVSPGTTRITITGTPAVPGTVVDLDAYFVDSNCRVIGTAWDGAYVLNAPVPGGTTYVLVDLTLGAEVTFRASWT
ncbi:MAG: extracellular elastinolytic metalloproteinase [Acidimicrobiaceae bacterium]|nr:extracellular elastinolytic metalloproteinase [Acidimicrobiaceae bacterium]